jgi:dolichyl-phosphate-mannose--protein O-mannosyl transferase
MVVVAAGVYLATWIPWLRASGGFRRDWGANNPDSWVVCHFGEAMGSLWQNHVEVYGFHTSEGMQNATHTYASNPLVWLVNGRTTGVYAQNGIQPGDQGCTAQAGETCMRIITAVGTPFLWWAAAIALVVALVWWLAGMDWRFSIAVVGTCSTWLPWVFNSRGAMFNFYAVTMIPFMVIGLAMVMGVILGRADAGQRRRTGAIICGTITGVIVANFAFFYPVLTGQLLTRFAWSLRMWIPGWI